MKKIWKDINAAVFDLDGTLIDSMYMWKDIDVEYLARFNIPMPETLQKDIEGMGFHETAVYFKKTFGITDSQEKIERDWNEMAYDHYCHTIPLKEGTAELLQYLKEKGIKMGIATSNYRNLTEAVLVNHGIREYFQEIITAEDVKRGKPNPDTYLKAAEKLQEQPEHCLVFEDVPAGIEAGKRAGMKVCAVYDRFSADMTEEKKCMSDYYIRSFREMIGQD